MKKQLVILGIVAILVCVGLSGCNNTPPSSNKNKFIGSWTGYPNTSDYHQGHDSANLTCLSDGTYYMDITYAGSSFLRYNGTWEVTDTRFIIHHDGDYIKYLEYEFSNDDNTLRLEFTSFSMSLFLTKQ